MPEEKWVKVKFAFEMRKCGGCDEPMCGECNMHWSDCPCPGPHQEDEYEYKEIDGVMFACPVAL